MHWVISEPVGEDDSDDSAPGNISNFPLSEQSSLFCLACTEWGYTEPQGKKAVKGWHLQQRWVFFLPSQRAFKAALPSGRKWQNDSLAYSIRSVKTASVCTDLCSCWGSVKGIYQAKSPTAHFYSWPVQHSTTRISSSGKGCSSCSGDHLAGGEDGISAWNGADRYLGRGGHDLQGETLVPSYSPLKLILSNEMDRRSH